jgi:hypothetical protein
MASLSETSEHVLKLFGVVTQYPQFICVEFCAFGSLYHVLRNRKDVTWKIALPMLLDCAGGLKVNCFVFRIFF